MGCETQTAIHFVQNVLSANNTKVRLGQYNKATMDSYCLSSLILHLILGIDIFVLIVGIIGNVAACVVIACNKSMHTPTNFYLFSLSVSDLLLLAIGAPHEMYYEYEYYSTVKAYTGTVGCFFNRWAAEMPINVSIITIAVFTFERYLAICRPFVAHAMSKVSRVKKIILINWLIGALLSVPIASQFRYKKRDDGSNFCEFDSKLIPNSLVVTTTLFFVLPMTVITVMYVLIGMTLRRAARMPRTGLNETQVHKGDNDSSKKTLQMLIVIVLAFFLCWTPFHVQRLLTAHFDYIDEFNLDENINFIYGYCILTHVGGVTYLVSAVVNPIIYSVMSIRFRKAFKELLLRVLGTFSSSGLTERRTGKIDEDVDMKTTSTNIPMHY